MTSPKFLAYIPLPKTRKKVHSPLLGGVPICISKTVWWSFPTAQRSVTHKKKQICKFTIPNPFTHESAQPLRSEEAHKRRSEGAHKRIY